MSLRPIEEVVADLGFPRVSGDEPARLVDKAVGTEFSPRERG